LSYSGGTMTLTFQNNNSQYTPGAGGTYTNAEFYGATVQLYASVTGVGAPTWSHGPPAVFTGVVVDVSWQYESRTESTFSVTVVDRLTQVGTLSFAATDSGNGLDIFSQPAAPALTLVLEAANAITTSITQTAILNPTGDTGNTMQAVTNYTGTAGALIQSIENSDGGDVYVRHGLPVAASPNDYNTLTFRTRGQLPISEALAGTVNELTPLNVIASDLTPQGTEPHDMRNVALASSARSTYSQANFTSTGGTLQTATAPTANINSFGARSIERTGLLAADDAATLNLAQAFLHQYGVGATQPLATESVQLQPIRPGENDGWKLVKYSVGDSATIKWRPDGATADITLAGPISSVAWSITPQSSTLTIALEDGDQTVGFILDSDIYGRLDINRLG